MSQDHDDDVQEHRAHAAPLTDVELRERKDAWAAAAAATPHRKPIVLTKG